MRRLTRSKKKRILDLLFSGNTYREVESVENVSLGGISNTVKEFIAIAEESSIEEAALEYTVEDRIYALLDLSQSIRKLKVSLTDLLPAAMTVNFVKAQGLKLSQLEAYLKMCEKYKGDFTDFASKATEFYQLEEETDKSYTEIVKEYSKLIKKRNKLKGQISDLRVRIRKAKKTLEKELRTNNLTMKEIPYASALKETLNKHGFSVKDVAKIPKFLREIKACGGNVQVFLKRAEEAGDLKWEILNLKDEKKRLEPIVKDKKEEYTKLQDEIEKLKTTEEERERKLEALRKEIKSLNDEAERKNREILLAKCIISILESKPTHLDALYNYLTMLKQIMESLKPQTVSRKPYYEKAVRNIIVNAFIEYSGEDLAPKEKVVELEKKVKTAEQQISALSHENVDLKKKNKELSSENATLKKELKKVEEELEKCQERILQEPTIPPESREFPFEI